MTTMHLTLSRASLCIKATQFGRDAGSGLVLVLAINGHVIVQQAIDKPSDDIEVLTENDSRVFYIPWSHLAEATQTHGLDELLPRDKNVLLTAGLLRHGTCDIVSQVERYVPVRTLVTEDLPVRRAAADMTQQKGSSQG